MKASEDKVEMRKCSYVHWKNITHVFDFHLIVAFLRGTQWVEARGEIAGWSRIGMYRGRLVGNAFCGWKWNISILLLGLEAVTLDRENWKWLILFTSPPQFLFYFLKQFPLMCFQSYEVLVCLRPGPTAAILECRHSMVLSGRVRPGLKLLFLLLFI